MSALKLFFKLHSLHCYQSTRLFAVQSNRRWLSPNGFAYRIVSPAIVSDGLRTVQSNIIKPHYADIDFNEQSFQEAIPTRPEIHSPQAIEHITESCRLARLVLEEAGQSVEAGTTCQQIDDHVFKTCMKLNVYPSPLNYKGFPKSVTTSVNNVAVHGIPDSRCLEEGDIITVDVSVFYNGYHGDTASTFAVGKVDNDALKLMLVAKQSLDKAISICTDGQPFNEIGKVIEKTAMANQLSIIPSLCGHGIGRYFHGPPQILHYDMSDEGEDEDMGSYMCEGMIFTIEPVVCEGQVDCNVLDDGWTISTADNSRSAQFEHTILVTSGLARVLT